MGAHRLSQATSTASGTKVLATVTLGLKDFIDQQGANADQVFDRSGLGAELNGDLTLPISLDRYCQAFEEAERRTGVPNFALGFGRQFCPESLGLLGYLATSSPTLREAMQALCGRFHLHQNNSLMELSLQRGMCHLRYQVLDGAILHRRHDAELSLAMFLNVMRRALGPAWAPAEVHLEHERPGHCETHREVFGTEVHFLRPVNAIVFRPEVLDTPMPQRDQTLNRLMGHSLALVGGWEGEAHLSLSDRVRSHIQRLLPLGEPRLDEVAAPLAMPPWTLQRRLAAEGHTFKELVERVRRELAPERLLADRTEPVSAVAFQLGYAEVSAFSRAFQRWYDLSPSAWRERHLG